MQYSEINNTLGGLNRRLDEAEARTSDLEDKVEENPDRAAKKKKRERKKERENF